MDTERIMALALEMAGLGEIPTDSGIWVPGRDIRRVLMGLDITAAELQIAREQKFDLALAHHPPEATLRAWRCYLRHVDQMAAAGVPRDEAEAMVAATVESMQLAAHARNYDHTVSVARLLGMPFMNIHTPLDEIGRQRMQQGMDDLIRRSPGAALADVLTTLQGFDEVRHQALPPFIAAGTPDTAAGRIIVAHGALDIPNYDMLSAYFAHGYDTAIVLRITRQDMVKFRQEGKGSVIVVGHLAGDSVGIVPFVAALRRQGIEVVTFSGILDK